MYSEIQTEPSDLTGYRFALASCRIIPRCLVNGVKLSPATFKRVGTLDVELKTKQSIYLNARHKNDTYMYDM